MPRTVPLALLTCVLSFSSIGCGESGIGAPCTVDPAAGNLQVLRNSGECTTSVCIAYLASAGYCSIECTAKEMCPSPGYLCCPVVQTGAQVSCTTDADCSANLGCKQNQCKPRQYCVKGSSACQ